MNPYDHRSIEQKWQARWEEARVFATPQLREGEEGMFILDMFPFPSGAGLHVGHVLGYTGTDIISRAARMQGKKVLHPMGWDAFGLPAENYALKTGIHPAKSNAKNVAEFKRQLSQAGMSYDWEKEINSSDPEYYRWTQWLFAFLYKRGLAYRKEGMVNWCPNDQTVLANEQVVGGHCERCGSVVVQKSLKQWYFKITDYAERLLQDLDTVDWPDRIKAIQRNWIGKSEGARLHFAIEGSKKTIEVFTTRPDTIFGATYMVLAPEHELIQEITTEEQRPEVNQYQAEARKKTELERLHLDKKKTGVWTGAYALHPITRERLPIWISDYVLSTYGTGAIMAVPAHDERDFAFAQNFKLPIVQVISTEPGISLPSSERGKLMNSGEYDGSDCFSREVVDKIITSAGGERQVTYRLRDWLVSRQRYWGSPIPIAYDDNGAEYLVPEDLYPVELPENVEFSSTGKSPLAGATEWLTYVDSETGQKLVRETDTLDGFVCSSWYYLRFPTPHNDTAAFDPVAVSKWLPVDLYVGGAEHAVLHLLYARFIAKALFDAGLIPFEEPFQKLQNQGMVLGPDHNKMSKSKGNVINPDDVMAELGADTLRTYEMFMGPFEAEKPWSTTGIVGVRRFLEKAWKLQERVLDADPTQEELRLLHRATKKITEDIAEFKFNTCVSTFMETVNGLLELPHISRAGYHRLLTLLSPFAPHITEELWALTGGEGFCSVAQWPAWDAAFLVEAQWECPVQFNGKVRARVFVTRGLNEEQLHKAVEADVRVQEQLKGKAVRKVIIVPERLVSYVLGE
jgi:leucyl-tRNA synthetase